MFRLFPCFVIAAAVFFSNPLSADIVLDRFDFDESAGASFSGWTNSGTNGTNWAGTGGNSTDHDTDGLGFVCITGDNDANRFINHNTFADSGIVTLEFRYESIDMSETAAAATGTTSSLFGNFGFTLRSGTTSVQNFRIQLTQRSSPELRFQSRDVSTTNTATDVFDFNASSFTGGFTIRSVINLDTGDMDVFYALGSDPFTLGFSGTYGASTVDTIQYVSSQSSPGQGDQLVGADNAKLDYLQFSTIPEPSSFLTLSMFLGCLFMRRRN
ncbi:MAG: hypothetical protein AAF456_19900 [Planctomycetota bacterium]